MRVFFYLTVSFIASVAGAICGIGGGVIIKPVLDLFRLASVSTISFLSGCTVLSMSCYSVGRNLLSGESKVNIQTGTPLAIGAALGGIVGKQLFSMIRVMFSNANKVGAVQAILLAIITFGTLLYTINKKRISTLRIQSTALCLLIGLFLGLLSSFLGIGGGPINLVVLFFFFSMDIKTAAQNSLYIILFSQITSLLTTLFTKTIPDSEWIALILMVAGGIIGGMTGRAVNKKLDSKAVDRLFICLMIIIIGISIFNSIRYSLL